MEFINLSSSSSKFSGGSIPNFGSSLTSSNSGGGGGGGGGGYRIRNSSDFQITLRGELIQAP